VKRHEFTPLSDDEVIRTAAGGDHAAFTELVRRYEQTVYRFSLKLCRDPRTAEEVLQDTFINVFRKLRSFDGKSKFSTWLYAIVANNCLMKRRKRKLEELEEPLELLDTPLTDGEGRYAHQIARWEETPADLMLNKELRTVLDAAILKLPDLYRAVFVLRDVEGKTTEETGEILGVSQEAVKSRLRRARSFLREQLDPYMTTHRSA
jgi:RNA polymerase sigma-70 factor (ECF subfamily)